MAAICSTSKILSFCSPILIPSRCDMRIQYKKLFLKKLHPFYCTYSFHSLFVTINVTISPRFTYSTSNHRSMVLRQLQLWLQAVLLYLFLPYSALLCNPDFCDQVYHIYNTFSRFFLTAWLKAQAIISSTVV